MSPTQQPASSWHGLGTGRGCCPEGLPLEIESQVDEGNLSQEVSASQATLLRPVVPSARLPGDGGLPVGKCQPASPWEGTRRKERGTSESYLLGGAQGVTHNRHLPLIRCANLAVSALLA